ncbi:MAG: DUF6294 family protein [Labedaea sp.]
MEVPNATAARLIGSDPWRFTWELIRKGAATMCEGATWTLYPDGTATFLGTVTSDDDGDTWVIWHVDLVDAHGAILGSLINQNPVPGGDHRKFVRNMTCRTEPYAFHAWAIFEIGLWNDIAGMKMHSSC